VISVAFDARDAHAAPLRGWGRYALELSRALSERDDVVLDCAIAGGPGPELWFEQVRWPAQLRRSRPDVVHAPNCFLPLRRSCPGVVTVQDLAFEEHREDFARSTGWKYRAVTRRAVASAERVICISSFTADDVVARYGIDPAKVRVIPNGPALRVGSAPAVEGGAAGTPYMLAIGDLRAKKNLDRLVEAWRLSGLPHRLVLAGAGTRTWDGVETPGYLDDVALDALLRGAALLVHPSLYEGFGLVIVEAMARGIPVACADATALPETAGGAAELFDPYDPSAITEAMHRALGRSGELAALGRARAAELSWERVARETAAVYAEAVAA